MHLNLGLGSLPRPEKGMEQQGKGNRGSIPLFPYSRVPIPASIALSRKLFSPEKRGRTQPSPKLTISWKVRK
jgi:hypothetical protein